MTDPIEVMARGILGEVGKHGYPTDQAEIATFLARGVVTALDAAGYAIVPKEGTEAILDIWHDGGLGDASCWQAMVTAALSENDG